MTKALTLAHSGFPAPVGDLDSYIRAAHAVPMLEKDEEFELAWRLRRDNDLEAAQRLILSHLRFVISVARDYLGYGLRLDDLVQEGNVGLMKAVKRFDPEQGVRLATFAMYWIRAEIVEFVLRNWRIVKVATTKAKRKLFFNLRKMKNQLAWFTRDQAEGVAEELGVSTNDVLEMEGRLSAKDTSFDVPHTSDSDQDDHYAPRDYLADLRFEPTQSVEREEREGRYAQVVGALEDLDPRSRDILQRRWLMDPPATLQDLGDEYGVSAERIRQIEAAAIKKLRNRLVA